MFVDGDKPCLLDRIRTERAFLERTLDLLSNEQMTSPALNNGRSVKDILAHIAAWEQVCIESLEAVRKGEKPSVPILGLGDDEVDNFNEGIYTRNKDRALADVQAEFQHSYEKIVQFTESLTDDELFNPGHFAHLKKPAYWPVVYNTYDHYREHALEIRTWMQTLKS